MSRETTVVVTCDQVGCYRELAIHPRELDHDDTEQVLARHGWQFSNLDGEDRCPDHRRPE